MGSEVRGEMFGVALQMHTPSVQPDMTRRDFFSWPLIFVARDCPPPGYIIVSGVLNSADHEREQGVWEIGFHPELAATLALHPNNPRLKYLDQLNGKPVELVIREPETYFRISR